LNRNKKQNPDQSTINGSISSENVSYTYEDTNIKSNSKHFFCKERRNFSHGKTGSGSQLLYLISRLYDVNEGQLKVDDNEIQHINLLIYEIIIGIVLAQDAFLFSD
jgi:ATP-binding cassette subfamily B protein